jgi:ABC-type proline/glycine betaine transport system ATPase subunit
LLINETIETEKGTVVFQGELEKEELSLVIQIGLNYLLQQGALPFSNKVDVEDADETNIQ